MLTLPSKRTKGQVRTLPGDWRRRYGSKTDAHLWRDGSDYALPVCRKNIEHYRTQPVIQGQPCADCLVAAIRAGE